MMPSLDRMQRIILDNPEAIYFIVSPNTAKYMLGELMPLCQKDSWPKTVDPVREGQIRIFGRELHISPGLRNGDFFPVYTSSPLYIVNLSQS